MSVKCVVFSGVREISGIFASTIGVEVEMVDVSKSDQIILKWQ